jgi:hypothetical protein
VRAHAAGEGAVSAVAAGEWDGAGEGVVQAAAHELTAIEPALASAAEPEARGFLAVERGADVAAAQVTVAEWDGGERGSEGGKRGARGIRGVGTGEGGGCSGSGDHQLERMSHP